VDFAAPGNNEGRRCNPGSEIGDAERFPHFSIDHSANSESLFLLVTLDGGCESGTEFAVDVTEEQMSFPKFLLESSKLFISKGAGDQARTKNHTQ
jgi:hypothetical protein